MGGGTIKGLRPSRMGSLVLLVLLSIILSVIFFIENVFFASPPTNTCAYASYGKFKSTKNVKSWSKRIVKHKIFMTR